jgi:hypothetical protein
MAFDISAYKRTTAPLEFDDLDFSTFARQPLDPAVLRCLRYMHDIEHHTSCYLRDLLVTRAHRDPTITTFLAFWNFEEFWHGEAIGRVLAAHGEPAGDIRVGTLRRGLGWRDQLRPLSAIVGSSLTPHFTAVHMTWGAINEWCTQAGYAQLAARAVVTRSSADCSAESCVRRVATSTSTPRRPSSAWPPARRPSA